MSRNEIVTTGAAQAPAGKAAKQAYDALVQAVARDNGASVDPAQVTNVELANGKVTVEYVDKASATDFDPAPVKHLTANVK